MDSTNAAPATEVAVAKLEVTTESLQVTTETEETTETVRLTAETLEVITEEPLEAAQLVIVANQTPIPHLEDGKITSHQCNGDSSNGGELYMPSHPDGDGEGDETTLEHASELFEKGSKAIEDGDLAEAVDSLSRALEIRVANYGELAPECASYYYKYGCALLCKAQEETDPLGNVSKTTPIMSGRETTVSNVEDCESSKPSTLNKPDSSLNVVDLEVGSGENDQEDDNDGCPDEDEELGEAEEDDSDLDYAWKMLDIARAIVEKNPEDSLEKVNVFAALGEVSMEREDVENSLSDYHRALAMLEHLVEPDHRRVVELNFRICLVLELGYKVEEAIPYCEKAISLCKSRIERLREVSSNSKYLENTGGEPRTDLDKTEPELSSESSKPDSEIDVLRGTLIDLEKKLEDLQQLLSNPKSILTELLNKNISALPAAEKNAPNDFSRSLSANSSQMAVMETDGFDSPTISTAANNGGVQHLGVVGRGIKRATVSTTAAEPSPKKPTLDSSAEDAENSISRVPSPPPSSESSIK